ncbi:hypothetical protein SLS55_009821 [Diplodia seriata]|uniref:F-box domain-containing protein n=1 Tax=Diplodia seriata TaxID=420778 RepID=A0ABR3C3P3_9PEZI
MSVAPTKISCGPRLQALPEELLRKIATHLVPTDMFKLRLTCKMMAFSMYDVFIDKILENPQGKLSEGTLVYTLPANMQTILGITEDDRVAQELRTLTIGTDYPTNCQVRLLETEIRGLGVKTAISLRHALKSIVEDYEQQVTSNRDKANMTMLFARLKNLKTVLIGPHHITVPRGGVLSCYWQRRLLSSDYNKLARTGFRSFGGLPFWEAQYQEPSQHDRMLLAVLSALAANQTELENFSVSRGFRKGVVSISTFDQLPDGLWKRLPTCFAGLKTLSLAVSNAKSYEATFLLPETWMDDKPSRGLQRLLAMTPNLGVFELAANYKTSFGPDFTESILRALPKKLRDIHLHNFVAYSTALMQFLDQRTSTLYAVGFTDGHLIGGSWAAVFDVMLSCELGSFKLGPLYLLEEDCYHWSTFADHLPVPRVDVDKLDREVVSGMYLNGYEAQHPGFAKARTICGYANAPWAPGRYNMGVVADVHELLYRTSTRHSMWGPHSYDEPLQPGFKRWEAGPGGFSTSKTAISTHMAMFAKKKFANRPDAKTA